MLYLYLPIIFLAGVIFSIIYLKYISKDKLIMIELADGDCLECVYFYLCVNHPSTNKECILKYKCEAPNKCWKIKQ